ncbi:MAG: adenylate/guanylate cyclase, partial [Ignavibacteria bacterium]|nr:adenylate/guanylate cyclase [Ignavibacteria bacterium]
MTVYNFILAFLSGCLMIFAIYYLFAVIYIHKKIFDKHFYFVLACIFSSLYLFFQLLLSLNFTNVFYYVIFNDLKVISGMLLYSFYLFIFYDIYFYPASKLIPKILFISILLLIVFSRFSFFKTYPINIINVELFFTNFVYHLGKSTIFYLLFAIVSTISLIASLIYYFFSKSKNKRITFVILITIGLMFSIHDYFIGLGLLKNIMINEYIFFFITSSIFFEFLKEDRKTYFSVVRLSKQLKIKNDEAIQRLKIMEIYTRKSLVESIEKGEDPTKFLPNNIQIATLFTDIRDFTGISEGMKPLEVVDLLNAYFNRMNSTIIKHNGEIDKLMGDCIMALYKNPDDALKSAIEMRYELAIFNKGACSLVNSFDLEKGNLLPYNRTINNGIGL